MNLKLNLKVLAEIREDLKRVEHQLVRVKHPELREKYREQVKKMQESADVLFLHYKTILESQK